MNTSKYIPYESVSGIILETSDSPEFPFMSGTGFFAHFPPYKEIFFITARHCVVSDQGEAFGEIRIPFCNEEESGECIPFCCRLETSYTNGEDEREDVAIYVVDEIPEERRDLLLKRALRLQHQDTVDSILEYVISNNENIRTVGFPSVSKGIDYDSQKGTFRPRGFYAKVLGASSFDHWYRIDKGNWKEESLEGFSGSPVLALCPNQDGKILAIPVGIFLTRENFLSINPATNLIANYILSIQEANNPV